MTCIDQVEIKTTSMSLNGTHLHASLHSRDDPITDNEYAEKLGFAGFMELREWIEESFDISFWNDKTFHGTIISWRN